MSAITTFEDYRAFLKSRFEQLKKEKPKVSFEFMARKLGVSKTFFQNVLAKKRHLSLDKVSATARAFNLNYFEKQFLTYQVCLHGSRDAETRSFFVAVLDSLVGNQRLEAPQLRSLKAAETTALRGSVAMLVHALANVEGFQPDPKWILPRMTIVKPDEAEVRGVLEALMQAGLIVKTETGWKAGEAVQTRLAEGHFHVSPTLEDGLFLASRAAQDLALVRPALFSMSAQAVSAATQKKVIDIFMDARKRMMEVVLNQDPKDGPADRVVFSLTSYFGATQVVGD